MNEPKVSTVIVPAALFFGLLTAAAAVREPDGTQAATALEVEHTLRAPSARELETLSRREREVARWVAEGLPNKSIASALCISPKTVEAHLTHIMNKLDVSTRTQIAAYVFRNGLATDGSATFQVSSIQAGA